MSLGTDDCFLGLWQLKKNANDRKSDYNLLHLQGKQVKQGFRVSQKNSYG